MPLHNKGHYMIRNKRGFFSGSKRDIGGGCAKCVTGKGITYQPFPIPPGHPNLVPNGATLAEIGPHAVIPHYGGMNGHSNETAVYAMHKRVREDRSINPFAQGANNPPIGISGVPAGILGNIPQITRGDLWNVGAVPSTLRSGYSPTNPALLPADTMGGAMISGRTCANSPGYPGCIRPGLGGVNPLAWMGAHRAGGSNKRARPGYFYQRRGGCVGNTACAPCAGKGNSKRGGNTNTLRRFLGPPSRDMDDDYDAQL